MRTSFHHQPEAQHPHSPAINTPAGRLPHLLPPKADSCTAANSIATRSPHRLVHAKAVVDIHVFRSADGAISANVAK